jgi:pyruvate/2-oxoglutarate dehydrogenase complex dihydrolipoamide dehydrogenase (E3) component
VYHRGVVEVDNHFQTSIEGIYAAGDLIGPSLRYPQSKNKKPKSVKNPLFNQFSCLNIPMLNETNKK